MKRLKKYFLVGLSFAILGCCGAYVKDVPVSVEEEVPENVPEKGVASEEDASFPHSRISGKLRLPVVPITASEVEATCGRAIGDAEALRDHIVSLKGDNATEGAGESALDLMNDIDVVLDFSLSFAQLMANVHPDKDIRTAQEKCQQELMKFVTALLLNKDVYDALSAIDREQLEPLARRSLDKNLRAYRRSGVDKDATTRARITVLNEEMVKTGQSFSRTIREDKKSIEIAPEDMVGLPGDFIKSHPVQKNGKVKLTTDYPDFFPVQNYAQKESVRKELYKAFLQRAYPQNEVTLKKLLGLRHEFATLLGYENWAEYTAEDKMAKNGKTISSFIEKISTIARPRMERDLSDVLKRKKQDIPDATAVNTWDRFYYVQKVQAEKYGVDGQEVRKYFDYTKVLQGVLAVNEELFGVTFREVKGDKTWHESVLSYDVIDDGKPIGRFYLDMHPREGKYGHAAMFNIVTGVTGQQLPVGALVCNFSDPSNEGPALMEHGDVETFFHEFGHLMHHILGSGYPWLNLSGIACEWDFVEAPSQLLEEWAWSVDVLQRFAVHHDTGEVIPAGLVEKMRKGEEFGKGLHVMRQLFYAGLSYGLHSQDPKDIDLLGAVRELQEKYSPYPYEDGTYVYANFGHLEGYSSMYYTYMWSLNLAKDLFTRFKEKGLFDKEVAKAYRKYIVGAGGAVDASDMVQYFLGREPTFDAFKDYLEN